MLLRTDLPVWAIDLIQARADALGVPFEDALLLSLDIKLHDPNAQSVGWAVVEHRERARMVAARMNYTPGTVQEAARRYRCTL